MSPVLPWYHRHAATQVDWGLQEYAASLGRLPGRSDAPVAAVRSLIRQRVGAREVIAFERGRSALRFLLEWAVRLPTAGSRRRVLIPALLCKAVCDAVRAAGLEPVLCDTTPDGVLAVDSLRAMFEPPATLAIVVPHVYGWPADIAAVEELARPHGVVVVDDAAAALGGRSADGRPLGTCGDGGVYSFSQGKPVVGGGGGVAVLPAAGAFAGQDGVRPEVGPALPAVARRLFRRFLWQDAWHRFSGPLDRAAASARARLGVGDGPVNGAADVRLAAMSGLPAAPLLRQLQRLDALAARRRRTYAALCDELDGLDGLRVVPWPEHSTPTRFLVVCRELTVQRDAAGVRRENPLAAHLRRRGVEARYPYLPLSRYRDCAEFARSPLPHTETLADRGLLLPVFGRPSPRRAQRIGAAVREFFGR